MKAYIVVDDLIVFAPDTEEEFDRLGRALTDQENSKVRFLLVAPGTDVIDLRDRLVTE